MMINLLKLDNIQKINLQEIFKTSFKLIDI